MKNDAEGSPDVVTSIASSGSGKWIALLYLWDWAHHIGIVCLGNIGIPLNL